MELDGTVSLQAWVHIYTLCMVAGLMFGWALA